MFLLGLSAFFLLIGLASFGYRDVTHHYFPTPRKLPPPRRLF